MSAPLSLRLSVTDRCNLRCLYCMPPGGVPKRAHRDILSFERIVRFVRVARERFGLSRVRLTGGEPLLRADLVRLVEMLACEGIKDLALTTNGRYLAELAPALARAGLGRVNVSLDSLDGETYAHLTRGGDLAHTLEGIEAALRHSLRPVKINTVVLRGHNDREIVSLARFAFERGCEARFLELMPIGCAASMHRDLFVPASEVRAHMEEVFSLEPLESACGSSSRNFLARDGRGRQGVVGFIAPETRPFCENCARLRLTSGGRLLSCLARGRGPDVRHLLEDDSPNLAHALARVIRRELDGKRARATFETLRPMATVGG